MKRFLPLALASLLGTFAALPAYAHFPWLVRNDAGKAEYFFGENLADRTYHMPDSLADAAVVVLQDDGEAKPLSLVALANDDFVGRVCTETIPASASLRSEATFGIYHGTLLTYFTKYQGSVENSKDSFATAAAKDSPKLDARVGKSVDGVDVLIIKEGKPLAAAKVSLLSSAGEKIAEAVTGDWGIASFNFDQLGPGLNAIMTGDVEKVAGEHEGKAYESVSNYLTLTFFNPLETPQPANNVSATELPELPFGITSFGAARIGDRIYVYGGHTGDAHSYSTEGQSNKLLELDLSAAKPEWKEVATGERLQGLAMVAHDEQLILVGGFTAMNEAGEEHDLRSQANVHVFNTENNTWSQLPALPEPRSSHDAAVIGDKLYVVGGWQLSDGEESKWHDTAWVMDLATEQPAWTALPKPPMERRALATIAHNDRLYVIGGMNHRGGPTMEVVVFDPQSNEWTTGPELPGENKMGGFGASGWSVNGRLVVTNYVGDVLVLNTAGDGWEQREKTEDARFFHRVLPLGDKQVISIGGASMDSGKFLELETVNVQ